MLLCSFTSISMPSAMVVHLVQEKVALRAVLRGRKRLQHDFQHSGSCSVPLMLALRNCSDSAVSVCVEAGPPSGVQPAGTIWLAEAAVVNMRLDPICNAIDSVRWPMRCEG